MLSARLKTTTRQEARRRDRTDLTKKVDINATQVNAASYSNTTIEQTLKKQENHKKRRCNQRVMEVEGIYNIRSI